MSQNILGAVFASLLNSLWPSAAIALVVWAALRFLPRLKIQINAATRCAAWWAVLAAILILPLAPRDGVRFAAPRPALSGPIPDPVAAAPVTLAPVAAPAAPSVTPATSTPLSSSGPLQITAGAGLLVALAVWGAFSMFRLAQILRSYRYLRGIKRRSQTVSVEERVNFDYWVLACGIDRPARLLVSSEIASPMAVGFRKPAVIIPETLRNEFTEKELDHVILHELAHIARRDDWTNLFARGIAALLPIHPVAVWVVKRIELDREIACDDWVVAVTGEARPYAASLTRLFELCTARRRQLLATGMADRGSHLGERIEALLRGSRSFAPRVSLTSLALGAAVLLGLVLIGAQAPRWVAFAQQPPAVPVPPAAPVAPVPQVVPAAPVPRVAPVPPRPQIAPEAPQAPEPLISPEFQEELQREMQNAQQEIQRSLEELQRAQRRFREPGTRGNRQEQLAAEAEMRALEQQIRDRQREVQAVEASIRAQDEQFRQIRQRGSDSFLAALVAAGYGNLSVDEIIELRNSGVGPEFLRAIAESGLKPSAKELTELAHNGVSPQYLRALRDGGFKNLSIQDTIEAARSGVRPDLVRALKEAFPQITMRQIIDAAHSGLNSNDLRQAREYGPNLTLEQIIRLKQAGVI